jgi:hypothetical protein
MARILFIVHVRNRASATFQIALLEQQPRRAHLGETSFRLYLDDNARHIAYVMLDWESLHSAHRFLDSEESHKLVGEWPIEKVLSAVPLQDIAATMEEIARDKAGKQ